VGQPGRALRWRRRSSTRPRAGPRAGGHRLAGQPARDLRGDALHHHRAARTSRLRV